VKNGFCPPSPNSLGDGCVNSAPPSLCIIGSSDGLFMQPSAYSSIAILDRQPTVIDEGIAQNSTPSFVAPII
jgi:hypothetical protein